MNTESFDIESICTTTIGKNLRKYINTNKDINPEEFRSKTASALSHGVNPEKLIINCLGGIYLQGKRAFSDPKSNAVAHLQDSIIAFELLLESGRVGLEEDLEESLKTEASDVSVKWRKRLVVFEGGLTDSNDGDIIGLSLFLSCFGFPNVFKCHELYQMLHLCDLRQKTKFLKLSPILLAKIPGIVQDLKKNNKFIAAAELVILYDLNEKIPLLPLLKSFVDNAKKTTGVDDRRKSQQSFRTLKDFYEKNITELKSLMKLLTSHGFDMKEFSSLKLDSLLLDFEKQISKIDQKLQILKRKQKEFKESSHLSQPPPSYLNSGGIYQPSQGLYYGGGGGGYPDLPPPSNHPGIMGPPGPSYGGNMGPPPSYFSNWPPSHTASEIGASQSNTPMDYPPLFPSYPSSAGGGSAPNNLYNFADRL